MIFLCDAILFDLDGTLVDSTIACEMLVRGWAARHGLDAELISAAAQGRRNRDIVREFTPHLPAEEEGERLDQEELLYREGNTAVRGALEIVSALPEASWALVTSASRRVAEMRLECAGFPKPTVLISSDDVRSGKPDPEGYKLAAKRLRVFPVNCLVVEDTPAGLEAGTKAGMQVMGITTTFPQTELRVPTCIDDFTCVDVRSTRPPEQRRFEVRVASANRI